MTMKDDLASIQHRGMMGASPDGDRAAGLRPQPPAASSQSSIPSALPRYGSRYASPEVWREIDELRARLRMIISHASGGHLSEPGDIDRSVNDICVEISRHHNRIWEGAKEAALRDAQGMEAAAAGETREAGLDAKHDSPVGQQADAPNPARQGEDHHGRD